MNIAFVSIVHLHAEMYFKRLRTLLNGRSAYAIWDADVDRGNMVAQREGAVFYAHLNELLSDAAIDGFVVCSENVNSLALLKRVMPMGKPVFCDKPMVVGSSQLEELKQLVSTCSAQLVSGYFQSYLGSVRSIAKVLESGRLGSIKSICYRNTRPVIEGRWFNRPEYAWFSNPALSGGGGFLDLGCHAVHCIRSLFGPIKRVRASIRNESGVYPDVDDFGDALLELESGMVVRVEAGWLRSAKSDGFEIQGTEGGIWSSEDGYLVGTKREAAVSLDVLPDGMIRMDRLLAVIKGEVSQADLRPDLEYSFDTVELMEAAYRSSENGRWVELG